MFILHSSNKTENLLTHLTILLETAPLASPFAKETFLIQSQGMERWLSQQLSSHFKVWGNYDFLFPGKFFSSMAQKIDSRLNDDAYDRGLMMWRIEALLRHLEGDVFKPLLHYLAGENTALKRFQLARQLAQIFDQYQIMRPDMLAAWRDNKLLYQTGTERWQQVLWQRLTDQIGGQHRGALWLETIAKLTIAEPGSLAGKMPERLLVFGINTLPPLFLGFLQGLAKHCQVHLFLLNPAQTFWADLESKRQRAKLEEQTRTGHPLLATLGQQGREFQEMLLEQAQFEKELDSFETGEISNVLQQLQQDILNNRLQSVKLQQDDSISIHACHSRMREVEVLKNLLLQALEADPELQLRDIVVMAPDIQLYAPFISAVFDDIQHAIADRSLRLSNGVLDAYIKFLRLSQSRFGWQAVLDLLEQPAVYPGFGLSETDLELVRHWIHDTNIRWGRSAEHKQQLGLPALQENTWQAGLDRLLMGYAVGTDQQFVDDILPYQDIEGASAQVLGGLNDFLQLLFKAGSEISSAKPLKTWSEQLLSFADKLFTFQDYQQTAQADRLQLNELLAELSTDIAECHDDDVVLDVIIAWLEDTVAERKSTNGFLRGQLTFCSMLPMRSIPCKVIALLGLNEGEFPKIDHPPVFDLLGQHFSKGDRSRRADDRYQFLEVLLSARQQLIITYLGQSISDNKEIPPSVVISELLDVLQDSYQLPDAVFHHPLQPFSERYFKGDSGLFSYSVSDFATASALADGAKALSPWWLGETTAEEAKIIDLSELFAFYQHPQKYFMQRQLSVHFSGVEAEVDEREPFALEGLDAYWINQQWIAASLKGESFPVERLQARGRWLSGASGEIEYDRQQQDITDFVEQIKAKQLGDPLLEKSIDLHVSGYRLVGKLPNFYQHGSLFFRYTSLKGRDLLQAWLHHQIINQVQTQTTHLLSRDEDLVLAPELAREENLQTWLGIFIRGQKQPNAFFVEPTLAYIRQAYKLQYGKAKKPAIIVAQEQLASAIANGYEPELRQLFQGVEDLRELLDADFEKHCETLLQPLWEATHGA